jgi:hypothetical protein
MNFLVKFIFQGLFETVYDKQQHHTSYNTIQATTPYTLQYHTELLTISTGMLFVRSCLQFRH